MVAPPWRPPHARRTRAGAGAPAGGPSATGLAGVLVEKPPTDKGGNPCRRHRVQRHRPWHGQAAWRRPCWSRRLPCPWAGPAGKPPRHPGTGQTTPVPASAAETWISGFSWLTSIEGQLRLSLTFVTLGFKTTKAAGLILVLHYGLCVRCWTTLRGFAAMTFNLPATPPGRPERHAAIPGLPALVSTGRSTVGPGMACFASRPF